MAALGGFKVLDFLHFCRRFKKPSHFQKAESFSKSQLAPKKPSHFQKACKVLATRLKIESAGKRERDSCSKASVVNNYEDNSWAFVVITCLFA
jgi:hypothetical protein